MTARWPLPLLALLAAPALAAPSPDGQIAILSDEDGRGIDIGAQSDVRETFAPASYGGADIADEFKRLCIDTSFSSEALAAASAKSPWGLTASTLALPASGKVQAFEQPVLQSDSARVSLWLGNDAGLAKRPILIRTRGALVTSGYGPFKAVGRQCNLDMKLSGAGWVDAFVARMNGNLAVAPDKLVTKPGFADGHWTLSKPGAAETVRVSFDAVDLKKPAQLLHIVVQTMPAKK